MTKEGKETKGSQSPARLAANRANSALSTGPRTAQGKARSRFNGLQHGLRSVMPVIPGEDPEVYRLWVGLWTFELGAETEPERKEAETAADAAWRIRRCQNFEAALLARQIGAEAAIAEIEGRLERIAARQQRDRGLHAECAQVDLSHKADLRLRCVVSIEKRLRMSLQTVRKLQASRQGRTSPVAAEPSGFLPARTDSLRVDPATLFPTGFAPVRIRASGSDLGTETGSIAGTSGTRSPLERDRVGGTSDGEDQRTQD